MKKPNPSHVVPSFETFRELALKYNRIPVALTLHSDLETPLSAYLKLAQGKNGFLLESVEKNEQVARFAVCNVPEHESVQNNASCSALRRGG